MKIAFPTNDGTTITRHFGRAEHFKIFEVNEGQPGASDLRDGASQVHGEHAPSAGEHPGPKLIEIIADCQVLICGGMGTPALTRAEAKGIKVILTRVRSIDEALSAYIAGTLENDPRLVHEPQEHHN